MSTDTDTVEHVLTRRIINNEDGSTTIIDNCPACQDVFEFYRFHVMGKRA